MSESNSRINKTGSDKPDSKDYIKVAKKSDMFDGALMRIDLEDGTAVVLVQAGGDYFAIGDVCTHEEFHLSDGTLESHCIVCPGHGAEWDITSGRAKFDEELPQEPVYGVRSEGDDIYLSRKPIR